MNLNDQQLVAEAFEGTLDERGFKRLQQRLREDPEMVALYRDHALLHHSLAEEFEGRRMIGASPSAEAGTSLGALIVVGIVALTVVWFGGRKLWELVSSPATSANVGIRQTEPVLEERSARLRQTRVLLEDRFDAGATLSGRQPHQGASQWRLERGGPTFTGGRLDGDDYEAYFTLPADGLSADFPVLLVTVTTLEAALPFHTAGWAGVSLYQDGYEVCFFGDSFGPGESWSLDVKRRLEPIASEPPLAGPQTMTLRYDRRDGTVEMFNGAVPEGDPVARSKLLPGLNFDQVRIGASQGAGLALSLLEVRAVGAEPAR